MQQAKLPTPEEMQQYYKERADYMYGIIEESVKTYRDGKFGLGNFGLRDAHMPKLIELVNSNPDITNLFLDFNNIGNKGILLLARGLRYITKLSLHATNICDDPKTTDETLIALAQSDIKHLFLSGTILTNENVDLFITHSKQTKIYLGDNDDVDEEHKKKAKQKANENSAAFLKMTLLGESSSKRAKKDSDTEQTLSPNSLDSPMSGKK